MTRVLIGNSAWVFSKIEVIWVPGTHWPLVLWVWTYPPNCVPRARFSGKLRWKSEYQFFWEPPGKYIFFQATALLILGVSSWWKWTSQPLFSKLLKIGIWMYLDVFGRCSFWRSILNHLWPNPHIQDSTRTIMGFLKGCPVLRLLHDPSKTPAYIFLTISHRHRIAGLGVTVPPGTPSVLFLEATLHPKPATIALRIGHLAFQALQFPS